MSKNRSAKKSLLTEIFYYDIESLWSQSKLKYFILLLKKKLKNIFSTDINGLNNQQFRSKKEQNEQQRIYM